MLRGVRLGGQMSPKLFTATIREVFKDKKGIGVDGEKLSGLRFTDDATLTTEGVS